MILGTTIVLCLHGYQERCEQSAIKREREGEEKEKGTKMEQRLQHQSDEVKGHWVWVWGLQETSLSIGKNTTRRLVAFSVAQKRVMEFQTLLQQTLANAVQ
ncbi:unnamed protein product [Sphenostylis stenocarpa]|uniref:Uncharacterized protein n=1 Tax=Sphenostylis stenocarpa TaxID=92480 RepID=A0AA86VM62_9FABA|nr:unnamed protein product [Sphenostylis stenocarpa]